jgi:hypothetical protein
LTTVLFARTTSAERMLSKVKPYLREMRPYPPWRDRPPRPTLVSVSYNR